jgi:hypothetical protein
MGKQHLGLLSIAAGLQGLCAGEPTGHIAGIFMNVRVILRAGSLGQHRILYGHTSQSGLLSRCSLCAAVMALAIGISQHKVYLRTGTLRERLANLFNLAHLLGVRAWPRQAWSLAPVSAGSASSGGPARGPDPVSPLSRRGCLALEHNCALGERLAY